MLIGDGTPFVFIGRRETALGIPPYVGSNYVGATEHLVGVMLEHGHERIGLLSGLGPDEVSRDHVTGYRNAMAQAGLRPVLLDHTDVTADEAIDLIEANGLTAGLIRDGQLAEEIRLSAGRRGIAVPKDLSLAVLGLPKQPVTDQISWTGFSSPREQIGVEAIRLLNDIITGAELSEAEKVRILSCPFEPGETIAPARIRPSDSRH